MCVPMRSGGLRIEYNSEIIKYWETSKVKERLKYEVIRILLGHPYQRQPYNAIKAALSLASDITLSDSYHKLDTIAIPRNLRYERGLCFEEYYAIVANYFQQQHEFQEQDIEGLPNDGISDSAVDKTPDDSLRCDDENELERIFHEQEESAGLWEDDALSYEQVREVIIRSQRSNQWGTLDGHLIDEILASAIPCIDYRRILSGFRTTVLSSRRVLTRMRPSRRYGFEYIGSRHMFATKLLIAVDVSCSVSNTQLSQALSIINRFFKYGIEKLDVIQFDVSIKGKSDSLRKTRRSIKIEGRGGTDFQAAVDYAAHSAYDGLIMLTDGYAPAPKLPEGYTGTILWMLYSDEAYMERRSHSLNMHLAWISTFPKSRYVILPPIG